MSQPADIPALSAPEIASLAARAGLRHDPTLSGRLLDGVAAMDAFGQALAERELSDPPLQEGGLRLRADDRMPSPAETLLKGLERSGALVQLPAVPHAGSKRVRRREMRMTHIERVSDGKTLSLPSWPPTREDAK